MKPVRESELIALGARWVQAHVQVPPGEHLDLTPETDLIATGLLDSVDFIELLAHVEELTGAAIDLEDVDPADFTTLGGLCAFALRSRKEDAHVSV